MDIYSVTFILHSFDLDIRFAYREHAAAVLPEGRSGIRGVDAHVGRETERSGRIRGLDALVSRCAQQVSSFIIPPMPT